MGDTLLLRRAVVGLRRAAQEVTVLAPPAGALVGPGPAEAQAVIPWDGQDVAALFHESAVVSPSLRDRLARFQAAIAYTRSVALVANLGRLIPHVVQHDPLPPAGIHAGRWYAAALAQLGIDPPADADLPPFQATPEEDAAARDVIRNLPRQFIAVHPGSGSPSKNWPAERFRTTLERLAQPPWLISIGPADEPAAAAFRGQAEAILVRNIAPRVLGSVLSRAALFVGNDSGVSHTAAAWGAPTVALFGPTDPQVWVPEGPRVRALRSKDGRMESLEVDEVLQAATAIRSAGPARPGG